MSVGAFTNTIVVRMSQALFRHTKTVHSCIHVHHMYESIATHGVDDVHEQLASGDGLRMGL